MSERRRGVNVNPNHGEVNSPPPSRLREEGISAVRLVSRDLPTVRAYAQMCRQDGIFVLGILARESDGFVMDDADAIQIGNEPDANPVGSKSSWVMTPDEYVALWTEFRQKHPERTLITAGLLRANPDWHWEEVAPRLEGVNGIARHSYLERNPPDQLQTALDNVRAPLPDTPLWITEWHPAVGNIKRDETVRLAEIIAGSTVADFFYCWSDAQTPGRGLFADDGFTPKTVLLQYRQRADLS